MSKSSSSTTPHATASVPAQRAAAESSADPVVRFTRALQQLEARDFTAAARGFAELAADPDEPMLAARARVYLTVCEQRLAASASDSGDPYLLAVVAKNRGELTRALELCRQNGNERDERFVYLIASIQALAGAVDEAAQSLRRAVALEPKNRVHAFHDPDFAALRDQPGVAELFRVG